MNKSTDLTSYENFPNFALINKWRLIKKDPNAELSEPIEPIVYWVENSTPEEIIPAVVAGIENWNIAFEEAGFKNAIVAKIQPKDASWDAADYDYNVVRWSSEPDASLLGFGHLYLNLCTYMYVHMLFATYTYTRTCTYACNYNTTTTYAYAYAHAHT